jgi:hypothetical protein
MSNIDMTLFARYKSMINIMWAEGFRKYTANELNTFVGQYEKPTRWKRWNNNPYYSTRTYQTMLKQLGCICPVKRGVWQINGPIPEWFGSFHMSALTSECTRKELERSSFYWQSLPAKHKVNPWISGVDAEEEEVTTTNTNPYKDNTMTTVTILGRQAGTVQPKKIEFTQCLLAGTPELTIATGEPANYKHIELICRDYSGEGYGDDLMFAYNNPNERQYGVLYLGNFNDGVV